MELIPKGQVPREENCARRKTKMEFRLEQNPNPHKAFKYGHNANSCYPLRGVAYVLYP